MYLALTSLSTDPDVKPVLDDIAEAIEVQLFQHYGPFWQANGMQVRTVLDPTTLPPDASAIVVFDNPDQAGTLGWHSVSPDGLAYGRAFWQIIKESGGSLYGGANSLSVTLSHECLEAIGNPYVNFWADVDDDTQEAMELCDRVEADAYIIKVGEDKPKDIYVSNFLGPRAFRSGPGPYDWMRLLKSPWELRPGGYAIRRQGKKVTNLWGQAYPEERKPLKMVAGSRLQKRIAAIGGYQGDNA